MLIFLLLLFILGLFFGSFLNVIIDRLPRGESFLKGRSYCESCRHVLSSIDLIPLFSYLFLRGRCRYCQMPLSLKYPLLELLTGVSFVVSYLYFPSTSYLDIVFALFIVSVLIVVFFIDLYEGIIPFAVVIPAIVISLLYLLTKDQPTMITHLFAGISVFAFFFLLFAGTRGKGMGFGDVVYALLMGLLLGFPNSLLGLYIAFLTGGALSLILILKKRKKLRGSTIPFGPFLVIGTYTAFIWGNSLVTYFFSLLT